MHLSDSGWLTDTQHELRQELTDSERLDDKQQIKLSVHKCKLERKGGIILTWWM